MALIMGIETSCDETAAAVYNSSKGILSNCLFSQTELHKKFGGVIPELASRAQLEKINYIVAQALRKANVQLQDIDAVAVTNTPGLPGSLLVGLCFAKCLAYAAQKKIIGVNHLEAHAFSAMLEHSIPFPYICLTASGGHTQLYYITNFGTCELIGKTSDDAAGEAFDKIAKMMGLPYPGGPVIEKLAEQVNFQDFFNYPRLKSKDTSFSFSGLKTAVLYDLVKRGAYNLEEKVFLAPNNELLKQQVSSSLLVCITDIFADRLTRALHSYPDSKGIAFVGGVACNKYIRTRLQTLAAQHKLPFYTPSPQYCTDNAAMVAFVGNYKYNQNDLSDFSLDLKY